MATNASAGRSAVGAPGGQSTAIRRWPSRPRCSSAALTPLRLSNSTSPAAPPPAIASPTETTASDAANSGQNSSAGIDRRSDQAVDVLITELGSEHPLTQRVAPGVEDQREPVGVKQPASRLGDEPLLPEILERAFKHPNHPRPSDRERPRDRIRLIAELVGDPSYPLLSVLGDLHPAKGVGHRCGRKAGGIGDLADGDALGDRAHFRPSLTSPAPRVDKRRLKRFTEAVHMRGVDVHQHIWPPELIDALRARSSPPRLRGWTLELRGEPPHETDPASHDPTSRAELVGSDGIDRALISLSTALGIEALPPDQARALLDAYHEGALRLPKCFGAWASASLTESTRMRLVASSTAGSSASPFPRRRCSTAGVRSRATAARAARRPRALRCSSTRATHGDARHERACRVVAGARALRAADARCLVRVSPDRTSAPPRAQGPVRDAGRARAAARRALHGACPSAARFSTRTHSSTPPPTDRVLSTPSIRAMGVGVLVGGSDRPYAEPQRLRSRRRRRRGAVRAQPATVCSRSERRFGSMLFQSLPRP